MSKVKELIAAHKAWCFSKPSVRYSTKLQNWKTIGRQLESEIIKELFKELPSLESFKCDPRPFDADRQMNGKAIKPDLYCRAYDYEHEDLDAEYKSMLLEYDFKLAELHLVTVVSSTLYFGSNHTLHCRHNYIK